MSEKANIIGSARNRAKILVRSIDKVGDDKDQLDMLINDAKELTAKLESLKLCIIREERRAELSEYQCEADDIVTYRSDDGDERKLRRPCKEQAAGIAMVGRIPGMERAKPVKVCDRHLEDRRWDD